MYIGGGLVTLVRTAHPHPGVEPQHAAADVLHDSAGQFADKGEIMLDFAYHAAPVVPARDAFRRRRMQLFTGIQGWVVRRYLLHGLILAVSAGVVAGVAVG